MTQNVYNPRKVGAQPALIQSLFSGATGNGTSPSINLFGWDGALSLEVANGAGTCTLQIQGSFENFATAQNGQAVGLIQTSSNNAGTITGVTSRSLITSLSVAANTNYSLQINDIFPYYQAVITNASGLGNGTYVNGISVNLYSVPQ